MPGPSQNIANAVATYLNAANRAAKGNVPGLDARDARPAGDFADLVKDVMHTAIDNTKTGESLSIAAVRDEADLNKVVTAVAEAELTLQTVVAVRDKVIEAYREILRMPI